MTSRQWMITGWALIAATAVLAMISVVGAFAAIHPAPPSPWGGPAAAVSVRAFLLAVVIGVLAGVTFFSGLACVFWGAARQRRDRLDEILLVLEAGTGATGPA